MSNHILTIFNNNDKSINNLDIIIPKKQTTISNFNEKSEDNINYWFLTISVIILFSITGLFIFLGTKHKNLVFPLIMLYILVLVIFFVLNKDTIFKILMPKKEETFNSIIPNAPIISPNDLIYPHIVLINNSNTTISYNYMLNYYYYFKPKETNNIFNISVNTILYTLKDDGWTLIEDKDVFGILLKKAENSTLTYSYMSENCNECIYNNKLAYVYIYNNTNVNINLLFRNNIENPNNNNKNNNINNDLIIPNFNSIGMNRKSRSISNIIKNNKLDIINKEFVLKTHESVILSTTNLYLELDNKYKTKIRDNTPGIFIVNCDSVKKIIYYRIFTNNTMNFLL